MFRATLLVAGMQDRRSFARTLSCAAACRCALVAALWLACGPLAAQSLSQRFLPAAHKPPRGETVSTTPHPAIVRIIVPEKDGISYGSGSLVDVRDEFGLVVTNWHVIRDAAGAISVLFPDGFSSRAEVVKVDKDWDLAALSIRKPAAAPLPMTAAAPQPGQRLIIAGYGSGDFRASAGKCLGYGAPEKGFPQELVEVDTEARHGDSGGPILNEQGEIAGVLFGTNGSTHGSYGGRVLQFLTSVLPGGDFARSASPLPTNTIPQTPPDTLAANVPPDQAFAISEPETSRQLSAMALHPSGESAAATDPLEERRYGARSDPDEQGLVPIPRRGRNTPLPETDTLRSDQQPDGLAAAARSETPLPSGLETGRRTFFADGGPPSSRNGAAAAGESLEEASAVKLLAEVWRKFGGTSVWEQSKAVLALIGLLALFLKFWRMSGQSQRPEDE